MSKAATYGKLLFALVELLAPSVRIIDVAVPFVLDFVQQVADFGELALVDAVFKGPSRAVVRLRQTCRCSVSRGFVSVG